MHQWNDFFKAGLKSWLATTESVNDKTTPSVDNPLVLVWFFENIDLHEPNPDYEGMSNCMEHLKEYMGQRMGYEPTDGHIFEKITVLEQSTSMGVAILLESAMSIGDKNGSVEDCPVVIVAQEVTCKAEAKKFLKGMSKQLFKDPRRGLPSQRHQGIPSQRHQGIPPMSLVASSFFNDSIVFEMAHKDFWPRILEYNVLQGKKIPGAVYKGRVL